MLAIMRLSSSYLLVSTFFVTLAQSKIGFQAGLFVPFLALPPIQIQNMNNLTPFKCIQARYLITNNRSIVFHMKNRKQKLGQPKKITQNLEQTTNHHFSISSSKQFSGHTKVSTNCTIHQSLPLSLNTDKKMKAKKIITPAPKQNSSETKKGHLSSKSHRKWKVLAIPLNVQNPSKWNLEVSHREYCVVDQNFLPITPRNQQKFFEDFFSQTASTSYDSSYFKNMKKYKGFQDQQLHLRKRSVSSRRQGAQNIKPAKRSPQQEDKSISNLHVNKVYASAEIEAIAEVCQIGMQYSERKQFNQQSIGQAQTQKQVVESQMKENTAHQSLSDILFKLEFTHLIDEKSFSRLSSSETEHYSQLLESLMSKLSRKQKQPETKQGMRPIFFGQCQQNYQEENLTQTYKKPATQHPFPFFISSPTVVNFDRLEQSITRRQLLQKNMIECNTKHIDTIDTSLLAILNFLGHFFCYIELQYNQEFLYMICKMYGFSFRQKYRRITRNLSLYQEKKFKVVDDGLFLDFINECDLNTSNKYQVAHLKAIFDALNEVLEQYRPYYTGNGQQFPWSFKLFTAMSEYSIDQESLQIIFRQAKEKILQWAQILCGILADYDDKLPPQNPLAQKKKEKEAVFIISWIKEQNFQKDGIQLFCAQILHDMSQGVFNQLLGQLCRDAAFSFI